VLLEHTEDLLYAMKGEHGASHDAEQCVRRLRPRLEESLHAASFSAEHAGDPSPVFDSEQRAFAEDARDRMARGCGAGAKRSRGAIFLRAAAPNAMKEALFRNSLRRDFGSPGVFPVERSADTPTTWAERSPGSAW
jgi:hypothetical protein